MGNQQIWAGPIETTPWWWSYILQLERRIESLYETSAMDPDQKPPPRDLFPISRQKDLDEYLKSRSDEAEKRRREKPLDNNY